MPDLAEASPTSVGLATWDRSDRSSISFVGAFPAVHDVDPYQFAPDRLTITAFAPSIFSVSRVDYLLFATNRISQLRSQPSPWNENGAAVEVAAQAERAALAIFEAFRRDPPRSAVAIFPRPDGGLRLQSVGRERTVLLDITADGAGLAGEYAGEDVFHEETLRSIAAAASFIAHSTQ